MPVVNVNYSRLQKLVGNDNNKIAKTQIKEALPFLGLDIESETKDEVRIEYSPNRPDYSTDYGIALGLQGLLGVKKGMYKLNIKKSSEYDIKVKKDVIKAKRPFVTGIIAKGNTIKDEKIIRQLMTMQEDLHFGIGRKRKKTSIGIHDLDKISFPITYTTASRDEKFIPLNSQQEQTISEILNNTQVGKDYGHIIQDSKLVPIIVDSANNIISLPPIINSALTTVTVNSKNLLVEITGINKDDAEDMLAVVATTLQSAGFQLYDINITGAKNSTPIFNDKKIVLDQELVNKIIGIDMSPQMIISSLKKSRLDAEIISSSTNKKTKKILCHIPRYRFDIFGEMDLIEEVALGYGMYKITPMLSPQQTIGEKNPQSKRTDAASITMIGLGYLEVMNSSLTSKRILYDVTRRDSSKMITVVDSKSQEHMMLRDMIMPELLDCLSRNIHESYPQKIFEIGTVFLHHHNDKGRESSPIKEKMHLACVSAHKDANFSEMRSVLQAFLKVEYGVQCKTKAVVLPIFEKGRSAEITVNGKTIGHIGEINSKTIEDLKIRVPIVGFEIELIFN